MLKLFEVVKVFLLQQINKKCKRTSRAHFIAAEVR